MQRVNSEKFLRRRPAARLVLWWHPAAVLWMLAWLIFPAVPLRSQTASPSDELVDSEIGTGWRKGFEESDQTSWSSAGSTEFVRVVEHARVEGRSHSGHYSECFLIENRAGTGTGGGMATGSILLVHSADRAILHPDLVPKVFIRSNQMGIAFSTQVVLPQSRDPATGRPFTFLIRGSAYNTEEQWQELKIGNLSTLVERSIQALRAESNTNISATGAYLENLVLTVSIGPARQVELLIDDLSMPGYVTSTAPASESYPVPVPWEPRGVAGGRTGRPEPGNGLTGPTIGSTGDTGTGTAGGVSDRRVRRQDPNLFVADQPFFPRVLQYNGEPFVIVKKLGFNAVWFPSVPSEEMLQDARAQGLWVCMPPPIPVPTDQEAASEEASGRPAIGSRISAAYDSVLAWDLGTSHEPSGVERLRAWAARVRAADSDAANRFLLGEMNLGFNRCTWAIDGMVPVFFHPLLGTGMSFSDYRNWVRERAIQTKPGLPFWVRLETQPEMALRRQWSALDRQSAPDYFPYEMMELAVWNALTSGARGFIFMSHGRLDAEDTDTRIRAMTLELVNSWLTVAEPWLVTGQRTFLENSTLPDCHAMLCQSDRARLLLICSTPSDAQNVLGQASGRNQLFTIPGIPDTNRTYSVRPGRLQPEASRRVAGGCGISFSELGPTNMALITSEPQLIAMMTDRLARCSEQQLALQRSLAEHRLASTQGVIQRLQPTFEMANYRLQFEQGLGEAKSLLVQMQNRPARWTDAESCQIPIRLVRALRLAENSLWNEEMRVQPSVVTSPGTLLFDALPAHVALTRWFEKHGTSPIRVEMLLGGDFERADEFSSSGWKIYPATVENLHNGAELHREAAYRGTYGLRLFSESKLPPDLAPGDEAPEIPTAAGATISLAEARQNLQLDAKLGPTVEVISPPVTVPTGALLRISGWYFLTQDSVDGCDGLVISESAGGPSLSQRITRRTESWQRFVFYRVAVPPPDVDLPEIPFTLHFTLHGFGDARIDAVTMEQL